MGPIGWPEMAFIFVLALLLFGPRKLPELGRTVGRALVEFRRVSGGLKETLEQEMRQIEQETRPEWTAPAPAAGKPAHPPING